VEWNDLDVYDKLLRIMDMNSSCKIFQDLR
jgi:hypothetical protein